MNKFTNPTLFNASVSKLYKNQKCIGPNSLINSKGVCVCNDSYPFGDPFSAKGCWSCEVKCHRNAICISSKKCRCKKNYFGNGIDECSKPTPYITKTYPQKCDLVNTEIYFSMSKITSFIPDKVFCRFGSLYFDGEILNSSLFRCDCPSSTVIKTEEIISGISFDKEKWSIPKTYVKVQLEEATVSAPLIILTFASLITMIVAASFWYRRLSSESRNDDINEVLPLNKWHMAQIQKEVGDESRVIDFIIHIIFS